MKFRSAGRSKAAIPALLLSGRLGAPARSARPARGRPVESARLSWRATVMPGVPAGRHRGPPSCSPLCLTVTGGRAAARVLARVLPHGTVSGRRRTTAPRRLLPSSQRLVPMISGVPNGHARDRRQRPVCPAAGEVRGGGTAVGVTFRLMNGHRVAGSDPARGLAERGNKAAMFHADLHIHSKLSRACSRGCDIPHLAAGVLRKGTSVLGTGDFTHPAWRDELKGTLVPAEAGLPRLRPDLERDLRRQVPAGCEQPVRFMLSVEISTIYRRDEHTRKVHHLIYAPTFEAADRITASASKIGDLASDAAHPRS